MSARQIERLETVSDELCRAWGSRAIKQLMGGLLSKFYGMDFASGQDQTVIRIVKATAARKEAARSSRQLEIEAINRRI